MGFETLVEAGYQPESAYFECLHELKLIVDLMYQGGLNYMRYSISNTAEYGDYTRGPRIVNEQTRAEMKKILAEIQSGQFAREWILENKAGQPGFHATKRREREHPVEQVGKRLRGLMTWIDSKTRLIDRISPELGRAWTRPRPTDPIRDRQSPMADLDQKVPENVAGRFYVDATCIDCDLCRETAPANFVRQDDEGYSYVIAPARRPRRGEPPAWRRWRNAPSRRSASSGEG